MGTKRSSKLSTRSQGSKTVECARCHGDIEPYAGRAVSLLSGVFAHQPGQCQDRPEQAAKAKAWVQDTMFGWSCAHVEPSYDGRTPESCHVTGGDRAEFAGHMKAHGRKLPGLPPMIKLRKSAPVAARVAPAVPAFKTLRWTESYSLAAGSDPTEVERRGQFWSNGPDAHSVWAITYTPFGSDERPELVKLWVAADGSVTRDYSNAAWSRREAARQHRAATERLAA